MTFSRLAVVTGGARGIGRSIAELLLIQGIRVAIIDFDLEQAAVTAKELSTDSHRVTTHRADVSRTDEVERAIGQITAEHGDIGILCNNAGIGDGLKRVADTDDETLDRVLGVNLRGPSVMCRTVLPSMLTREAGIIINIASVAGIRGARAGAAYTASKHGVIGLTSAIAATYGDRGIRCNAVCPGRVASGMPPGGDITPEVEADVQRVRASMPRRGEPDEIAAVVGFLVSNGATFMNGSAVVVDGGWTAP